MSSDNEKAREKIKDGSGVLGGVKHLSGDLVTLSSSTSFALTSQGNITPASTSSSASFDAPISYVTSPSVTSSHVTSPETAGGEDRDQEDKGGMKKRIEKVKQQSPLAAGDTSSRSGKEVATREISTPWPPLKVKGGRVDKGWVCNSSVESPCKNKKFGANIDDLQVHLAGRRSSCSALPGILESKIEEEEDSAKIFLGSGSLLFKLRVHQERSHSICLLRDTPADDNDEADQSNSITEEVETPAEFCGGLNTPEDSRVQSSRTWPQSAIRSAAAIDESLLEGLEKGDSTFCESLGQIPQINVSHDTPEISIFSKTSFSRQRNAECKKTIHPRSNER